MQAHTPGRRWKVKPWPWPGDSREDKAKRVALAYRDLIFDITQGHCDDPAAELHRLNLKWAEHGIYWHLHRPELLIDPDEWMSAPDLAHALDRTRKDIYNWARLGHITQRAGPDGTPEYLVASVLEYHKKLRNRRTATHGHAGN
jgi:hypothetical protein